MKIKSILNLTLIQHKGFVFFFFVAFFVLGISIFKGYGVHWDHDTNRYYGEVSFQTYYNTLVGATDPGVVEGDFEQIHGPAFEVLLNVLEQTLTSGDSRDIAFIRHLATFLLFYLAVFFFYLLCKRHFNSWKIGLLGSLFLVLSPRIFAHSFYNSVDIACLSLFIISIYTLVVFLDKKTFLRAAAHAFTCAILIDIRNLGAIVSLLTFFFLALEGLQSKSLKAYFRDILPALALYTSLLMLFTVLFWPYLWVNPITKFIDSFIAMAGPQWGGSNLYFGQFIHADKLPWHYNFVWMFITIPLFYSVTFVLGSLVVLKSLFKSSATQSMRRNNLIFILWLGLPLAAPAILQSTLFDGWRHHYFVYPAFLIISLNGVRSLIDFFKRKSEGKLYKALAMVFIVMITASLARVVDFMVRNHPYQNVYFNALAGKDLRKKFELDYWGLSYREALEYILEKDPSATIKVAVAHHPGRSNHQILTPADRKRLSYVGADKATYFLSEYRWHKEDYPYKDEFFSITVNDAKIMVVYKLR